jgi:hypothetical protein
MIIARILVAAFLLATVANAQAADNADLCHFIADHQAALSWPTRLPGDFGERRSSFFRDYFMGTGSFDLDGDGIVEEIKQGLTGTAGGDAYDYTLSSWGKAPNSGNGFSLLPKNIGDYLDENRFTFGEGFLPFNGRIYDVTFQDERGAFVVEAHYLLPGGGQRYACVFRNQVKLESWSPGTALPAFRADIRAVMPRGPAALAGTVLEAESRLPASAPAAGYSHEILAGEMRPHCYYRDAGCKDVWKVDFDNDGRPDRLLLLSGNSSAGRGYDGAYFVLLAPDGSVATGKKQDLLLKLQSVDLSDVYPTRPGQMELRWLKIAGRTVLERRAVNQPPTSTMSLVDDVWIARGEKAARLLYASFRITPEIAYSAPPQ